MISKSLTNVPLGKSRVSRIRREIWDKYNPYMQFGYKTKITDVLPQDAQYQLREEILSVGSVAPSHAVLRAIPYFTSVIYKTLRLFPPISQLPNRKTTKTVHMGGKIVIPKGTYLGYNAYVTKKECEIELTPLPGLHLLKDMGRSPSGTLFPRYLVKGLYKLCDRANDRGEKLYEEEYEEAKVKRREIIHRWQDENPDSILADDPVSIYRTWPLELMDQLDAVDQQAKRRGSGRYMADLQETEKKMQALVAFWRDCGLVTGQRTPPSPQWPDPKTKLRGVRRPQYLKDKLEKLRVEFQPSRNSKEYEKRRFIEITRWKEAILNADSEPSASDTPFPQSLMDELDVVWQGYNFLEPEETEDEMITRITRWRNQRIHPG